MVAYTLGEIYDFIFHYNKSSAAYKMIGNAVPVKFANVLALKIGEYL